MLAFLVLASLAFILPSEARTIVKLNGVAIDEQELDRFKREGETQKATLDRLILFRLAVEDAKRLKIAEIPETRHEIEKALYAGYLKAELSTAGKSLDPSPSETSAEYAKFPMVRLRHLMLKKKASAAVISEIQKKISRGVPFTKLVLQYSEDESAKWGGDLDFRGLNALPEAFYQAALKLPVGGHAGPLRIGDATHFIELVAKKAYADAPAAYVQYLKDRIRSAREEAFLASVLGELRKKAVIEPVGVSE